ncbi:MAG: hypothetical protein LIO58_07895 [Oscillospiraceae bacterium]|nr:hypothetical protein [Oscillospiraceae bacterium]
MQMKGLVSTTLALGVLLSGFSMAAAADATDTDTAMQTVVAQITEWSDTDVTLSLFSAKDSVSRTEQAGKDTAPSFQRSKPDAQRPMKGDASQEQSGDEAFTGSRKSGAPQMTGEEEQARTERTAAAKEAPAAGGTRMGKAMPAGRGTDTSAPGEPASASTGRPMCGGFGGGSRTGAQALSGETLTLTLTDATSIVQAADKEKTALTADALQVGDTVIVSYNAETNEVNTIAVLGFTRGKDAEEKTVDVTEDDATEATTEEAAEETTEASTDVATEETTDETTEASTDETTEETADAGMEALTA